MAGARFLGELCRSGIPQARIAVDLEFRESWNLLEVNTLVQAEFGADLGFRLRGGESFTAMLALALLGTDLLDADSVLDRLVDVVDRSKISWRFRFFVGSTDFPPDTDCTAVAARGLYRLGLISSEELVSFARELLLACMPANRNGDPALTAGVPMVYWPDDSRRHGVKHDAVACANALWVLRQAEELGL